MDTFSLHLLWVRVYNSNKAPFVVGSYFFAFIREENGTVCIIIVVNPAAYKLFLKLDISFSFSSQN